MQDVLGLSFLGGMGFTMALLLADISFASGSLVLEQAKLAILCASINSGVLGFLCLVHRPRPHKGENLKDISNVSGHK